MKVPEQVIVHPLVLLSVVDNYNRVAQNTRKRVVGVLLGEVKKGVVHVTNSYAVPFEEDENDGGIWFMDYTYHENMYAMFRKINAREVVVGWYSTGPRLRDADLEINQLMTKYCKQPLLVIVDVKPKGDGIPIKAYCAVDEVKEDGTERAKKIFVHIASEVGAHEAEEIGVEHLLRDVKDATISTLSTEVSNRLSALGDLGKYLEDIKCYLGMVIEGKLPINHEIMYNLQEAFNLMPNLNVEEVDKAFAVKTNDMMMAMYIASLVRSVIALHNLINNKEGRMSASNAASDAKPKRTEPAKKVEETKA
ncbi:regulatory subunit of 26S proteasome [Chloropicon primus]|uniref:Regulatory subunit of 26S proteasome n=1 Tax=Chloropicon primus TaxID=1764295 RepID=A0A5B8MDZ5_9CHLO|nr:regulatory subunit of 26S proteasome [Chloropicon primus]UPQ97594.1 regulatory subunit of 26S proteasome [Chloropicon primus]|mmetsp:Transcript_9615/g.27428  ORF Transcript_9615/g.27428 Transcript_9615/m.27428 type:complete len:307 (-) Transcript_9615:77-997(-)|eukprot:QDZ18384.1 regulatory subunit of 26S proteasome [Chloropicon primus]